MARYNVCTQPRCRNPVEVTLESRRCGIHGGETKPMWGVYHEEYGWLTDTGVGGSYSFDVDQVSWFESTDDAAASLRACDLLEGEDQTEARVSLWRRIGPFTILLVK
jgi:hypothetical protein